VPVVVVQGEKDELVPAANAEFVARRFTAAVVEVERVPELGHFLLWQRPRLVLDAIARLLAAAGLPLAAATGSCGTYCVDVDTVGWDLAANDLALLQVNNERRLVAVTGVSRAGAVAGCYITDGVIARNNRVRVLREGQVVHTGPIRSIRRFKEDVREVREGFECGIVIDSFPEVEPGDILQAYEIETIAPTL